MNVKIHKISFVLFLFSGIGIFSQIKEEQLILDKKREPEVKKIEKKKTSVETIKNYPPEEKSQNPLEYTITNVPALSDFQTSTLQADDISPQTAGEYSKNYVQFGLGNYSRVLADANISYTLESKMEIGLDAHALSTNGLKKDYPWNSRQSSEKVGAFLNGFADTGKYNLTADFGQEKYNYYGIYALQPDAEVDLQQKVNTFRVNAFYDHFSNDYLNDARLQSSFLSDRFGANERMGTLEVNFSKHALQLPLDEVTLNADLGLSLETTNTQFDLLTQNTSHYFLGNLAPEVTFTKGNSYLMLGSGFSYVNAKESSLLYDDKTSKTYWFPRAEVQLAASENFNFYAGVDGGLELNSYASMLSQNPYLVSDQQIKPTETKYNVYFGVRGDVDQTFKYDISAGYSKINGILFYRSNDLFDKSIAAARAPYDFANTFSAVYDDGSKNEVKASLQYFPLENLSIDAEMSYTNYKLNNYEEIYDVPLFKMVLGSSYAVLDKKLHLGFKAFIESSTINNVYEISSDGLSPLFTTQEEKIEKNGANFDINLTAEYKVHKNFSIFAAGNNLVGEKYETYHGYQVLGAQILGGVKITF